MKTKKLNKKLGLSKTTITTLTHRSMKEVKGGEFTADKTCGPECTVYTIISCIPRYCDL